MNEFNSAIQQLNNIFTYVYRVPDQKSGQSITANTADKYNKYILYIHTAIDTTDDQSSTVTLLLTNIHNTYIKQLTYVDIDCMCRSYGILSGSYSDKLNIISTIFIYTYNIYCIDDVNTLNDNIRLYTTVHAGNELKWRQEFVLKQLATPGIQLYGMCTVLMDYYHNNNHRHINHNINQSYNNHPTIHRSDGINHVPSNTASDSSSEIIQLRGEIAELKMQLYKLRADNIELQSSHTDDMVHCNTNELLHSGSNKHNDHKVKVNHTILNPTQKRRKAGPITF